MKKHTLYTWDLSPLVPQNIPSFIIKEQKNISRAWHAFKHTWEPRTDYLTSPRVLRQALDDYEHLQRVHGFEGNTGFYFWLRAQQNETDPAIKAGLHTAEEFGSRMQNLALFFTHRISRMPRTTQKKMLANPLCAPYKHFLERLFAESSHLLSESEEKILTLTSPAAHSDWVRMTSSLLSAQKRPVQIHGAPQEKNFTEITSLISDQSKKTRDSAAAALNDILRTYEPIAEAEINAILGHKKVIDDLRKFSRADAARHLGDDIGTPVVDTLVRVVSEAYDISQKYYRLKARLLKVPQLAYHERNTSLPYSNQQKTYSFEETLHIIARVFKRLDPSYASIYESFITQKRVDVFPHTGKRSGAFCAHGTIAQPVYIMLNHTNTIHDVLTFAHELGHGINDELMKIHQNALTFGTTLATAETASTFMEDFVFEEILGATTGPHKLALIMEKLNGDVSTIFRQIACYQFEQDLHTAYRASGYLSSKAIGKLFKKHMAAYMGSAVAQPIDSERWWIHWAHIRSFFYNYSYASGLLISKSLQASVRKNPNHMSCVKEFLSAGLSDSPAHLFKKLGIDITQSSFWDAGIHEIRSLLNQAESLARTM